jgi:F420-0:gamma-glutamyl ligase-like protein
VVVAAVRGQLTGCGLRKALWDIQEAMIEYYHDGHYVSSLNDDPTKVAAQLYEATEHIRREEEEGRQNASHG